jgi:hypothetical protein
MQKQGVGSVFAEAALAGISKEALQNLIQETHAQFIQELKSAGFNIVDGEEILKSDYAQGKSDDKSSIIGKMDGTVVFDKVGVMDPAGYDTKERNIFRPKDKNVFTTTKMIAGNFYQRLSTKENVNLMSIGYNIKFANFEGSKTITKNKLTTTAELTITPIITITNPAGSFAWISFKKPVEGNNNWSKGLAEKASRDGSYFGLSSSADYAINADETLYINEVRDIILNLQKNLAQHIKSQL